MKQYENVPCILCEGEKLVHIPSGWRSCPNCEMDGFIPMEKEGPRMFKDMWEMFWTGAAVVCVMLLLSFVFVTLTGRW